jgi:HK97 family phage prohead protease
MENRALADINTKPTQEMANEAEQALEWRAEFGRGGTEVGVARARDLKNRVYLSIRTIKRMFSYLSRHEVDKEAEGFRPGEDGYPSAGRIAWGLWGGDAGFAWTKRKIKEIEEEENRNIMENKELRNIQKIEENEESIIIYYAKNKEDVDVVIDMDEEVTIEEDSQEIRTITNKEVRTFNVSDIEVRNDDGKNVVVGYGAVFNSESNDLGGFVEYIAPGAFDGRLEDDVRFLINHDGLPLARTTNNTLRLSVDERGLKYEADMPETTLANDLITLLRNGTISQSSFAFTVEDDSWRNEDGKNIRTINKVSRLYDVSSVTYPAYNEAGSFALRSLETWQEEQEKNKLEVNLEKELLENKKEELDLHKRNLAELRLKIKSNN